MKRLGSHMMGAVFALIALTMAAAVWILPAPAGETARATPAPTQNIAEAAPLNLVVLTARPAFDRTRRPLVVKATPAPTAPKPAAITLSLHGVIGNADGGLTALFRMSNTPELLARRIGEEIGVFTVTSIEAKQALLRGDDGTTQTLLLITE
ncbi:MAG: hypothetical protein AAF231_01585 [Pseudomonadota bacterium]